MPEAARKPCSFPGCAALVEAGVGGRCEAHLRPAWTKRPGGTKRITGRKLQRLRQEQFTREPTCRRCRQLGLVVLGEERDHIVPLAEGGSEDPENTQTLCSEHNREKGLAEALRGRLRSTG